MTIEEFNKIVKEPGKDIGTALIDAASGLPLASVIVGLHKLKIGIEDYCYIQKYASFLNPLAGVEKEADEYLKSLSTDKCNRITNYIVNLLSNAESTDKAQLIGFIYKACVKNKIDYEMMLRLSSIVKRAFIFDLKHLPEYKQASSEESVAANEFINLGLIDNNVGGVWINSPTWELNVIGLTLCSILEDEGWFEQKEE